MSMMRLARACLVGAVLCLAVSPAAAHPPDLPVDTKDVCVPCPDGDFGELNTRKPCAPLDATSPSLGEVIGRCLQSFTLGLGGMPVLDLDFEFLCGEPRYITLEEAITKALECDTPVPEGVEASPDKPLLSGGIVGGVIVGSSAVSPAPAKIDETQRAHARKMYLIGERCRRAGDFDMAENCYQETKLLCPGCDYALKAERRIREVRGMRAAESEDIGEESEPPKEEQEPAKKESSKDGNYNYDVGPPTVIVPSPFGSETTDLHTYNFWNNSREEPAETAGEPTSQVERLSGKRLLFETDLDRLAEAKAMYYVGERCRRGGDLDMAYRCYEDAYRICPQCRHAKKALQRMRRVKELKERELQQGSALSDVPFLADSFTLIDPEVIRAFEKLGAEETSPLPSGIEIVLEEARPMIEGDGEESEAPLMLCGGTGPQAIAPPTLYVAPPARELRLTDEPSETAQGIEPASCDDLSDWLPQAVRLLRGAGSLRIDTSRLGRLMSRGEGAVRALGCDLVHEGGRLYVVYPARPR
jgi:hypothetical protein